MKSIEIISIWYGGPISSSPADRPPVPPLKEEQPPALQPETVTKSDAGWSVGPKLVEKWPNQNDQWKNVNKW